MWDVPEYEDKSSASQAEGVVIQLKNADLGQFRDAIDYMKRNGIGCKDIKLINEYGKIVDLDRKSLKTGAYEKKIRGLL